jgi:hypothetical protein
VLPVRFESVHDGADDVVAEKVLSSDLDDAGRCSGAGGENCREVEIIRDDGELVLGSPRQDLNVGGGCRTDGGPVDSLEPVTRQPVDPPSPTGSCPRELHGWRRGTSTSSARQAA